MNEFKVGDKVLVSVARRGGKPPEQRECRVVEVVPAKRVPKKRGFYSQERYHHTSYIVQDAEKIRYRPVVSRIAPMQTVTPIPIVTGPDRLVILGNASAPIIAPAEVAYFREPLSAPEDPVTECIFLLDATRSMKNTGLVEPTRKAFNAQLAALKANAVGRVYITLYSFGSGVTLLQVRRPVEVFEPLATFRAPGIETRLFDSIGQAIAQAEKNPKAAYVLQVLTDGCDNASSDYTGARTAQAIAETIATDRWTHAIMLPRGTRAGFLSKFPAIPAGNVVEWDTTQAGAEKVGEQAVIAASHYMKQRSVGVTRSSTYFMPNLSQVTEADLARCTDLSAHFKRYEALVETTCRELAEEKSKKPFVIGSAFYQLTKREDDVQGYKQVLLRHRASGRIFGGAEARKLIGLQMHVDAKVEPGNHGDFEIYIESTSFNRILPRGAHMLHDFQMAVPKQPTWDHQGAYAAAEAKKNGMNPGSRS